MSDTNERSVASDGSAAGEPVAWLVTGDECCEYQYVTLFRENADAAASEEGGTVVPLYRHPPCQDFSQKNLTLTDAEREAVEAAARIIDAYDDEMDGFPSGAAATLRGLLERMK